MSMVDTVVVGNGYNALGVLRSLKLGAQVLHVLSDKGFVGRYSRYGKCCFVKSTTSESVVNDLLMLNGLAGKVVLVLTEEKTVAHVSKHWDKLRSRFSIAMPNKDIVSSLQDKVSFYKLALEAGSPVPKTIQIDQSTDLHNALSDISFPCVLKPAYQSRLYSQNFKKAYKVESANKAFELIQNILPILPSLVLQEWIEGEDSDIYFTFSYIGTDDKVVASFCGRKLYSWPPQTGGTAACVRDTKYEEELLNLSHGFMKKIKCVGLMGMEYKFDIIRKKFFMIEPTVARTDYQHEIASLSNIDFLGAIRRNILSIEGSGGEVLPRNDVVWYDPYAMHNLADYNSATLPRSSSNISCIHRWDDPLVSLIYLLRKLGSRFNRLLKRKA